MNALLVVLLTEQGHKVIATGRRQERLQELKDELGDNLYIAQLDVRNRAAIRRDAGIASCRVVQYWYRW